MDSNDKELVSSSSMSMTSLPSLVGETEDSALREAASDLARKIALALEPDF